MILWFVRDDDNYDEEEDDEVVESAYLHRRNVNLEYAQNRVYTIR